MLNVRVKKALLTILTACLTVLMTIGAILGFTPTTQTVKADSAWTLVKNVSDLKVDDQVIIVAKNANYALSTNQKSNNRGQAAVTKSGDTLTFTSSVQVLTLKAGKNTNTFAFYTGSGYLYAASSKENYLRTETTLSANSSWTISIATTGVATIKAQGTNTRNWLRHNSGSSLFSCYTSGQNDVSIYKKVTICDHQQAETVITSNGGGSHSYKTICNCGYTEEGEESCENYYETSIDGATTTFVCTVCGYSYSTTEETYTVSFCVPDDVDAVVSMTVVKGNTIAELPTAEAPKGYEFIGWVTKENQGIKAEAPEVFDASTEITEDIKLYALYKYEKAGITKVKDVSTLAAGDQVVIVANGYNYALSTTQNNNNRGQADVTKDGDTVTFGKDVQVLTLEAGKTSGTFAFNTGAKGYLYAASSGSNHLRSETTLSENSSWTIEIDENGVATIKAQGSNSRNWLRYNNSNSIFSCYGSGQQDICLYEVGKPFTAYTTLQFGFANMTLKDELTMNYKVAMDDAIAEDAEMTFKFAGETYENVEGRKEGNVWVYSLQVAPQYMGENITAVLKLGDTVLASKATYSVEQYLKDTLAGTPDEKAELKQLLKDLLLYGAAAQAHKGYPTEKLVADLNNLGAAPTTTDFSLVNAEVENGYPVYFTGANLNFSSLNTLYVTLSKYDEKVELYVNGEKVDLINNIYSTGTLQATDFDTVYTFELFYNDVLMQTLTYSVNAYAYQFASGEGTMADLARALYNYGKSVEAYVATLDTQN